MLTALKADPELAEVPVAMVTLVDERALASSLGAVDYLRKPVDRGRLVLDRFREANDDVLVVDDDAEMRRRLRQTRERSSWSVDEAATGKRHSPTSPARSHG